MVSVWGYWCLNRLAGGVRAKGSHRHQRRIGGGTGWKGERDAQDQHGNRGYNISGAEGAATTTTLSGREPRTVEQSRRRHDQVTLTDVSYWKLWAGGSEYSRYREDSLTRRREAILFSSVFQHQYGCRPGHLQSRLTVVTPPSPCSGGEL